MAWRLWVEGEERAGIGELPATRLPGDAVRT